MSTSPDGARFLARFLAETIAQSATPSCSGLSDHDRGVPKSAEVRELHPPPKQSTPHLGLTGRKALVNPLPIRSPPKQRPMIPLEMGTLPSLELEHKQHQPLHPKATQRPKPNHLNKTCPSSNARCRSRPRNNSNRFRTRCQNRYGYMSSSRHQC
ncbi:hypothetical protein SKAU_G00287390 [Synaphobranchus kaupii]|uniref:Uncharacterized protein n=1 Tax=Synaphobranchus kaupii TaxID=118154 RepID=A0A9Q1EYH9_SYNKA|nr:hypothetical protein SKAU_G00287390 [Synaphobranchus kaupii]